MNFYDELSLFYDQMISFETRHKNEKIIFEKMLKKYPAEKILDAGCGSGYHSILLASLGKKVSGFDPSEKMIQLANSNRKKYGLETKFIKTDFLNFPKKIKSHFDAVFTLGNSFAHLLNKNDILLTLKNFCQNLDSNGYVCIGMVNFDRVIIINDLEISKKEKNGIIFHRYYTLNEKTIIFHVEITNQQQHHFTTELYPLQSNDLTELAKQAGFRNVQLFGNLKLDKFVPEQSENTVAFLFK